MITKHDPLFHPLFKSQLHNTRVVVQHQIIIRKQR